MARLGDLISNVVDERGWEKQLKQQSALALWDQVVGPSLAKHCKAVEIANDTLMIEAKGPAWRSEISFRKDSILADLNKHLQPFQIKDIRFTA